MAESIFASKVTPTVFYSNTEWANSHVIDKYDIETSLGVVLTRRGVYTYQRYANSTITLQHIGGVDDVTVEFADNKYTFTCSNAEPLVIIGAT